MQPSLLLEPHSTASIPSALASGKCDLGSRVAFIGTSGGPPLSSRGTIVGLHGEDYEVLFDISFPGGTDLQGRWGRLSAF